MIEYTFHNGIQSTREVPAERTSSRACELCNPRDFRAMRALESLTPNGSEFVNDPEACVAFVRERLAFTVQLAKERNEAQKDARELREVLKELHARSRMLERMGV